MSSPNCAAARAGDSAAVSLLAAEGDGEQVVVIAVAHQRRRPDDWLRRV
jgi:hypothetical protein